MKKVENLKTGLIAISEGVFPQESAFFNEVTPSQKARLDDDWQEQESQRLHSKAQ